MATEGSYVGTSFRGTSQGCRCPRGVGIFHFLIKGVRVSGCWQLTAEAVCLSSPCHTQTLTQSAPGEIPASGFCHSGHGGGRWHGGFLSHLFAAGARGGGGETSWRLLKSWSKADACTGMSSTRAHTHTRTHVYTHTHIHTHTRTHTHPYRNGVRVPTLLQSHF